jgi:hypothetical protein
LLDSRTSIGSSCFSPRAAERPGKECIPEIPACAYPAIFVGEPSKRALCVMRVKLSAGMKLMPHNHAEDRDYPIISSVFFISRRGYFDPAKLREFPPGSVGALAREIGQFHGPKAGEYIAQVTAGGSLGLDHRAIVSDSRRIARQRNQRFLTRRGAGHPPWSPLALQPRIRCADVIRN